MIVEECGNVIQKALDGDITVIIQNCNCMCVQKKGFALQMAREFNTDKFPLEEKMHLGDYNKLGQIDYKLMTVDGGNSLWVVNAYCQFHYNEPSRYGIPLDYDALRLCMRKVKREFGKERIGLPGLIGSGLAKGRPETIKSIILNELKDSKVYIYYPNENP